MRIALFTDTYPTELNGVATTLGKLVAHGRSRGHEFALVTPQVSDAPCRNAAVHIQRPSCSVPFYRDLSLALGLDAPAKKILAAFDPDVAHVATEATVGLSGRLWAERRGVPLVTSYHTNFAEYVAHYRMGILAPSLWRYLRWFHGAGRVTFCPSADTRVDLREHGLHDRVRLWSRGVDTDRFTPSRRSREVRERLAPGAELVMGYVGRLAPEKRVEVLLEAFREVRSRLGERVALVVVGDGPRRNALEADAPEGTRFTGYLRGEELADAYAASDLFTFPSDTETFGNVVLEALASGVPAVVADRGGVRETVIPGRTGVRVPPLDSGAFAEACIRLLSNDVERRKLARGARAEALERSWAAVLDGVFQGYQSLLPPSPKEIRA